MKFHQFHGSGAPPQIERRKYHVRKLSGRFAVCIDHLCDDGFMRTLWATGYQDLIAIVMSGPARLSGGSFHIDPDGYVIVGVGESGEVCVGFYEGADLLFGGSEMQVSSNPGDLQPGSRWTGPSVGRRYKLSSRDLRYEDALGRGNILSDVDERSAPALAKRLGKNHPNALLEGPFRGGRIYVNEHRHVFAPLVENSEVAADVYLGQLRGLWFQSSPCLT